jgi:hypothetical protein
MTRGGRRASAGRLARLRIISGPAWPAIRHWRGTVGLLVLAIGSALCLVLALSPPGSRVGERASRAAAQATATPELAACRSSRLGSAYRRKVPPPPRRH